MEVRDELRGTEPTAQSTEVKVLLDKDGNDAPILGIIERNKRLFNNANISAVVSYDSVLYDKALQNTARDNSGEKITGDKDYINNLTEFYWAVSKAANGNPLNPNSFTHGFQIKPEYKNYIEAFLKYKGLPINSNIIFFDDTRFKGFKLESLLIHEATHSFKNPGISLSNTQVDEIIKAFEQIARDEKEYYGISSGNYLKEELSKGNQNEVVPVLAELYSASNGYYAKKILTPEQLTLLESTLFNTPNQIPTQPNQNSPEGLPPIDRTPDACSG
jgi:hypothetical protein